jgi:hypothetical protein
MKTRSRCNRIVEIHGNANTGNKTLRQGVFFPGQEINRREIKRTYRREITGGDHRIDQRREIKGATRDADQRRSKEGPTQIREDEITGHQRTRAEEPRPLRDKTSEGQSTL